MIIGIDASKTTSKKKTGIENTAYQIILGLSKIDKTNQYYLYTNKALDPVLTKNPNFIEKLIPFPKFWNRFRLPLALLKDKPDLFLELSYSIPPLAPQKSIVLIHDLAFKFFPEAYSKYELMLQENAINIAKNKASTIVFTGEANRKDFVKFYGKPKAKTAVIPLGFENNNDTALISEKKGCPYFLVVGRIEKRKNTARIVEAFELFKNKNISNHKLILIGKNGFGCKETEDKIANSKNKNDIIKEGYVDDKKLLILYKNASALVYPSLYEGFGFPTLEAMSLGTPVITSDIPTIKEVVGDAAALVDPKNTLEIATAMKKLTQDSAYRNLLIDKGRKRAKQYSWDKTAEDFYELISNIDKK